VSLRPRPQGHSRRERLRQAARLLSALSFTGDRGLAQLALVARLAALIEDIADLRAAQRHAAQAAAARRAAGHLHAVRTGYPTRVPGNRPRARTAAGLARLGFPIPPDPLRPATSPQPGHAQPRTTRTPPVTRTAPAQAARPSPLARSPRAGNWHQALLIPSRSLPVGCLHRLQVPKSLSPPRGEVLAQQIR